MQQLGAMLGPVEFDLGGGQRIQPFAIAPWSEDETDEHAALPDLLKSLRGEWVCVPFGMPDPPDGLAADWLEGPAVTRGYGPHFHGYSSNALWQLSALNLDGIEVKLRYPDDHPVRDITRKVAGIAGAPRLDFELTVNMRSAAWLPIGLHPVFRLPETHASASLAFGGEALVQSYPLQAEPGVSQIAPNQTDRSLANVLKLNRESIDLGRLPLDYVTEELVLVTKHGGEAVLTNHQEGYAVRLQWDPEAFESCLLWLSNRGRTAYPWNGRFQAIGIEPVTAPFDLGTDVAQNRNNPLARRGISTARYFDAGEVWTTRYAIEVFRN